MRIFSKLYFIYFFAKTVVPEKPLVETIYGFVEGITHSWSQQQPFEDAKMESLDAFYGIPFAQPPIGELRFEVKLLNLRH